METLPQRLQELRKAAGLSQEDLAARLGLSRQAVGKWETGVFHRDKETDCAIHACSFLSYDIVKPPHLGIIPVRLFPLYV